MARIGRGVEGRMNQAAGAEPVTREPKSAKPSVGSPGAEKKADMRGAGVIGQSTLGAACMELARQHPQRYDDLGPHHGGGEHVRHVPLAGLSPTGVK
jgi:hypothetical protein